MILTAILQRPEGEERRGVGFQVHGGTKETLIKLISYPSSLCEGTNDFTKGSQSV